MKIIPKVYLKKRKIKIFVIQNLQNWGFSIKSTPVMDVFWRGRIVA